MKIGITGGIGSGKSYVCRVLQQQGIEVFDCDNAAKHLMRHSAPLRQQLTALIGPDTYTPEGQLNKAAVAQFLLASPTNAKAVDAIVHPAVFEAFRQSGLQFMESAILYESGAYVLVDKVIAVVAPLETRIQRVMARDGISRQQVLQWMDRQMSQDEVMSKADFILINDGEADIDKQIHKIIEQCNKPF
jgi:dephospho-CoA kinase